MLILGLAGAARSGKDTVADWLAKRYGFIKFAFSDALYTEVQHAFGLEDQALLRDAETKEAPVAELALRNCGDPEFPNAVADRLPDNWRNPLSPRQVLQLWGTEFRRAQDPGYWVKQTTAWLHRIRNAPEYPEHQPQFFVNTTVRFPNEQEWVHSLGGNVWHVHRDAAPSVNSHVSEQPLPVLEGERELWNNDTIERLHQGVNLLLSTNAKFVKVEPMDPDLMQLS